MFLETVKTPLKPASIGFCASENGKIDVNTATARGSDLPSRLTQPTEATAGGLIMHDSTTSDRSQEQESGDLPKVWNPVDPVLCALNSCRPYYEFEAEQGGEPDEDDFIDLEPVAQRIAELHQRLGGILPYEPGYVYAINAVGTNYFKFGKSIKPDRRLLEIAPKMPFKTQFARIWPANFMTNAEGFLHSKFAKFRTNGEWFLLDYVQVLNVFQDANNYLALHLRNSYATNILEFIQCPDDYRYEELARFLHEKHEIFGYHCQDIGEAGKVVELIESCFTEINYALTLMPRDFIERAEQECIDNGDFPF